MGRLGLDGGGVGCGVGLVGVEELVAEPPVEEGAAGVGRGAPGLVGGGFGAVVAAAGVDGFAGLVG